MDEAERPIEEIIGWHYYPGPGWIGADDHRRDSATVDDLAAWLNDQGYSFFIDPHPEGWLPISHRGLKSFPWTDGGEVLRPTIREALIVAVRKVDALARTRV